MCSTPLNPLHWHDQPSGLALQDDWLFNQQSLTRRLQQLSHNQFSVRTLHEGWQSLRDDECQALNCPSGSTGWVREVFLCGRQQPWVYARSVASQTQLESSGFAMGSIGSRSLGEFLFTDPGFSRGALQICQVHTDVLQQDLQLPAPTLLWARRSCFSRPGLGILVAEAFLPHFWEHARTHSDSLPVTP